MCEAREDSGQFGTARADDTPRPIAPTICIAVENRLDPCRWPARHKPHHLHDVIKRGKRWGDGSNTETDINHPSSVLKDSGLTLVMAGRDTDKGLILSSTCDDRINQVITNQPAGALRSTDPRKLQRHAAKQPIRGTWQNRSFNVPDKYTSF